MTESNPPPDSTDPAPQRADVVRRAPSMRRARIATVVVLVLLVLGAGRTVLSRMSNANVLEARTADAAKQYVKTAYPKSAGEIQNLALPATLQGSVQAPISARASGYLRRWHRDIGSRV